MSCQCSKPNCSSDIVDAIIHSEGEPATVGNADGETITVNGVTGTYVNKSETECFKGPISLDKYPLNDEANPLVINKKPNSVPCHRKVFVKYLEPPAIPTPKPIIINQEANIALPEAPPVIIRQPPCEPTTPTPLLIREVPPEIPRPPSRKILTVPGKLLPPPPRKVVIERLPELPDPPQNVFIERWLPFKDVKRKITLRPKPKDPRQCKAKNIIVNWSIIPCCKITQDIKDMGVKACDPAEYVKAYGETLIPSDKLPEIANKVNEEHGKPLAANQNIKYFNALEGDLHALQLIEAELGLDNEGLAEFKHLLNYIETETTKIVEENESIFEIKQNTEDNHEDTDCINKKIHICEDGECRLVNQITIEKEEEEGEQGEEEDEEGSAEEEYESVESTSYDIDGSTSSTSTDYTSIQ